MGKKVTKYKTPLEHLVTVLEIVKQDKALWERVKPYLKGIKHSKDNTLWLDKPSGETEVTVRELIDKVNGAT